MSEAEGRLYGLMELAERQQAAVQAALDGMAAERTALAHERQALARDVGALHAGTQAAVRDAVAAGMAGAATEGVAAVQTATGPLLGRLEQVTQGAGQAEAALRGVVAWASWRLLGRGALVVAALAALLWGAHLSVWWWTSWDVSILQARKALLEAEIVGLQASRDEWVMAGMLGKLIRCNPGNRPCVRVDERAGAFESGGHADYRLIQGY